MTKEEHDMLQTAGKREWAEQPELIRNAFLFMWGMSDIITPLIETRKKFKLEIEYEPEQRTKYRVTMDDESGQLPDRAQPCSSQVYTKNNEPTTRECIERGENTNDRVREDEIRATVPSDRISFPIRKSSREGV